MSYGGFVSRFVRDVRVRSNGLVLYRAGHLDQEVHDRRQEA